MSNLKQTPKPSRGKPSQARSWSRYQKPEARSQKRNRNKIYNFKTLPTAAVLPDVCLSFEFRGNVICVFFFFLFGWGGGKGCRVKYIIEIELQEQSWTNAQSLLAANCRPASQPKEMNRTSLSSGSTSRRLPALLFVLLLCLVARTNGRPSQEDESDLAIIPPDADNVEVCVRVEREIQSGVHNNLPFGRSIRLK